MDVVNLQQLINRFRIYVGYQPSCILMLSMSLFSIMFAKKKYRKIIYEGQKHVTPNFLFFYDFHLNLLELSPLKK